MTMVHPEIDPDSEVTTMDLEIDRAIEVLTMDLLGIVTVVTAAMKMGLEVEIILSLTTHATAMHREIGGVLIIMETVIGVAVLVVDGVMETGLVTASSLTTSLCLQITNVVPRFALIQVNVLDIRES